MQRWKGTWGHDVLGAWTLLWSYAPIILSVWLFAAWPSVATFALAFVLTAFRQNALFVVAHESFHTTLFRSRRVNEVLGAWLAAYPIILPYAQSRQLHWEHHRRVGTEDDPDRYAWSWSREQRGDLLRYYLRVLTGVPFFARALRSIRKVGPVAQERKGLQGGSGMKGEILRLALVHLSLLGIYSATVGPLWYFALWLLPAITLHVVVDDVRQFLEHREGRIVIYRAGPLERFLFGPFNFHLHGFHHALPAEPWFCIPSIEARARAKLPHIVTLGSYTVELARYFSGRPLLGEESLAASPTLAAAEGACSTSAPSSQSAPGPLP